MAYDRLNQGTAIIINKIQRLQKTALSFGLYSFIYKQN